MPKTRYKRLVYCVRWDIKKTSVESCQLENSLLSLPMLNLKSLKTIKNYATGEGVTPSYIYKLVKERKMELITIDGVKFVDIKQYPSIPVANRRK